MKRDARDNDTEVPPKKMQRADLSNISVRFLIPARAAGLVIGKGGENIKKIRAQYSVKLNIPDTRGTERVFTVDGALSDICNVWRDIMPKVKDVMSAKLSDPKVIMGQQRLPRRKRNQDDKGADGNGEQQEGEGGEEQEEEEDTMVDLRILVHQSIAGCIIGKGGDRIRELRQRHKMRVIKVYQMLAPGSTDRVVQLIAEPENAIQCMEAIVEVAENTSIRGPTDHYDAANCSESDALTYGGWLSPEGLRALSQGISLGGVPMGVRPGGGGYGAPRGPPQMYGRRLPSGPPPALHYQHQPPQQMYRGGPPPQMPPQLQRGGWGYAGDGGYQQQPAAPPQTGYDGAAMYMQPPQAAYGASMQQNPGMQVFRPGPVPPPMSPVCVAPVTSQQQQALVQQPGAVMAGGVMAAPGAMPYGVPPPQSSSGLPPVYGYQQQMPPPIVGGGVGGVSAYPPAGGSGGGW